MKLLILFLVLFSIVLVSNVSALTISQQDDGYRILSATGLEADMFDVKIVSESKFCVNPKALFYIVREECTCADLIPSKDIDNSCKDSVCTNETYFIPFWLKLQTNTMEGSANLYRGYKGDFCVDLAEDYPEATWIRIGLESIVVVGDAAYNSTDTNVTQQTGSANLETNETVVAYYSFDQNTTTVFDYSDNDNDGVINGSTFNTTGKIGSAYSFDGGDSIRIANDVSLNTTDNTVTVSAWMKADAFGTDYRMVVSKFKSANLKGYTLALTPTGKIYWGLYEGGGFGSIEVSSAVNLGQWYHAVGVYSPTGRKLYVNGVLNVSDSDSGALDLGIDDVFIGQQADYSTNRYFIGDIDEVMIYNTNLTDAEILAIYQNTSSRFKDGGEQLFQDVPVLSNVSANVTLSDCQTLKGSSLSVSFNGNAECSFVSCFAKDCNATGSDSNMTIHYNGSFYSPLVIGNITVDLWGDSTPAIANSSQIDILHRNKSNVIKDVFDEGEDFLTMINWTDELNVSINDTFGECNITSFDIILQEGADDANFSLCSHATCDNQTYTQQVNFHSTANANSDFIHFEGCSEQLVNGDITANISCDAGSFTEIIPATDLPLCSEGLASLVVANTTVCTGELKVNMSVDAPVILAFRKRIENLALDRAYSEHTNTYSAGEVIYNDTTLCWQNIDNHESYSHGRINISANCTHNTEILYNNQTQETVTIANAPPQHFFNDIQTRLGITNLVDNAVVEYGQGIWNISATVIDDDDDTTIYNITNSSGASVVSNVTTTPNILTTGNAVFLEFANPYNISLWTNDTGGNITTSSRIFNVTDTIAPTFDNLQNFTTTANSTFNFNLNASDEHGIFNFTLNDTSWFIINSSGWITNNTATCDVVTNWLNVSAEDASGNIVTGVFFIDIIAPVISLRTLFYPNTKGVPYIQFNKSLDFT